VASPRRQDKLSIFVKGNAVKNASVNAASSIEITLSWSKQKYDLKGDLHLQSVCHKNAAVIILALAPWAVTTNSISCDHRLINGVYHLSSYECSFSGCRKILPVKAGPSFDPAWLPCQPGCLVSLAALSA
jgi:hypothetical protein